MYVFDGNSGSNRQEIHGEQSNENEVIINIIKLKKRAVMNTTWLGYK